VRRGGHPGRLRRPSVLEFKYGDSVAKIGDAIVR
jgi:hypothetical protein